MIRPMRVPSDSSPVGRNNQRALRRNLNFRDIDQFAASENLCHAVRAIDRAEICAAWIPGATIIGHDGGIVNVDMRRNALRLLTPYNKAHCDLRGLIDRVCHSEGSEESRPGRKWRGMRFLVLLRRKNTTS